MVLDVQMPDMSGLEVARIVRHRERDITLPIVLLSADTMVDRTQLEALGIEDYLTKPIEPDILLGAISRITGRARNPFASALDVRTGVERVAGNRKLYDQLVGLFLESQSRAADDVREDIERGNAEGARARLHNVKGVAANLGASEVATASARALEKLRSGDDPPAELDELRSALTRLQSAALALKSNEDPEAHETSARDLRGVAS